MRPGGGTTLGSTQLIRAALRNDMPRVLQLVQLGAPLDAVDRTYRSSALQWACELGYERVAEALLDGKYEGRGANIDLRSGGYTPLMLASWKGHKGVVRLLLARGARQELQDSAGRTALHVAVMDNHPSIVELLCAAPGAAATLALQDSEGRSALHWAVMDDRPSIVELLCAAPGAAAALALRDRDGRTALHWAVMDDRPSIVELLCAAPGAAAALALRDSEGRTPLATAVARRHAACEAALRAHGATV